MELWVLQPCLFFLFNSSSPVLCPNAITLIVLSSPPFPCIFVLGLFPLFYGRSTLYRVDGVEIKDTITTKYSTLRPIDSAARARVKNPCLTT